MPAEPTDAQELLSIIQENGIRKTCGLFKRPPLPSRLLRELYDLKEPVEAKRFIAQYPLAPSDLLETFVNETTDEIALAALVQNPRMAPQCITTLLEDEATGETIREHAARNVQLNPRDIQRLVKDGAVPVRVAVASNSAIKPVHQAMLATDAAASVRLALAQNINLDVEIAMALTTDQSAIVRCGLSSTMKADEELLRFWADCDREEIQLALLSRRTLPDEITASLLFSPHDTVIKKVLDRYVPTEAERLHLAESKTLEHRLWVVNQEILSTALQRLLIQDEAPEVRLALANHPAIEPELARYFITRGDEASCAALARNPATPSELLQELAKMGFDAVNSSLAYREDILEQSSVLEALLGKEPATHFIFHMAAQGKGVTELSHALAQPLTKHTIPAVRTFAAHAHTLSLAEQTALSQDPASKVRQAIAQNEKMPQYLLEALLEDSDSAVAQAAQDNLNSLWKRAIPAPKTESSEVLEEDEPEEIEEDEISEDEDYDFELAPARGIFGKLKQMFRE